jgi:adenosylcobinamide kinase/adenosylcobinamide-phosphate guanylyltransferase
VLTLVIGGARSGKSRYAEGLLHDRTDVTYVATGYPGDADDAAWAERVQVHRERRPDTWNCAETLDLSGLLGVAGGPLLIDCLTLWLTRSMDTHDCWTEEGWTGLAEGRATGRAGLRAETNALVEALRTTARDVVLVTNEVGQGVIPADPGTRRFVDEMGALNSAVAAICDDVVWCVAGRTVRL